MPTRRSVLTAASGAVLGALAGCTGDDTAGETHTETESQTETQLSGGEQVTVQTRDHADHGTILVDGDGMTLYMFDSDTEGELESSCSGSCASAWPPLIVDDSPTKADSVTAELETFDRANGDTQVAAGGWPLYYYNNDGAPGDATGQGVNDVWWVLSPAGEPIKPSDGAGGGGY